MDHNNNLHEIDILASGRGLFKIVTHSTQTQICEELTADQIEDEILEWICMHEHGESDDRPDIRYDDRIVYSILLDGYAVSKPWRRVDEHKVITRIEEIERNENRL